MHQSRNSLILICAIIGVALNLRPSLASISPLLDLIETDTDMTHTMSSLLTTLPVFAMGIFAYFSKPLRSILGESNGITLGLLFIAFACLARFQFVSTNGLLFTALAAGIGIAIIQALTPSFIKRVLPSKVDRVMGLYTTGIMGGAAIAAASAAKLDTLYGWPSALAIWAIPAFISLFAWLFITRKIRAHAAITTPIVTTMQTQQTPFWKQRRAWELVVFFGIGTGAYTLVLAWLPPFYTSLGLDASQAGFLLSAITVIEVIAGLTVSVFIHRFEDRRILLMGVLFCLSLGLSCLLLAPLSMVYISIILIGIGIGSLFPLSLILTLSHCKEASRAGDLVAFVQGGGYIIASFFPLLAGIIRDRFFDLSQAWGLMLIGTLLLILLSYRFSPKSYQLGDL
jgi:CP family cyanate transporter-like MFS transporter